MNLQFSIIGYVIIAVFYVLSSAILFLLWVKFERKNWIKPLLAVLVPVVVALPWAEELWIAWNFVNSCDSAGVHVTRKEEVDGFYDDTMRSAYEVINQYGYSYMEHRSRTRGKIDHVVKKNDEWEITELDHPSARYHYVKVFEDKPMAWQIVCSEEAILDSEKQSPIARRTYCKRYLNVIEAIWLRFLHHGPIEYCPTLREDLKGMLYDHVLIPSRKFD